MKFQSINYEILIYLFTARIYDSLYFFQDSN